MASIEAFHPIGTEAAGIYHYYTERPLLEASLCRFERMLEAAGPLLKIPAASVYESGSDITVIQNGLSVATMPEELVRSFEEPALYEEWKILQKTLLSRLEKTRVNECVTLADNECL